MGRHRLPSTSGPRHAARPASRAGRRVRSAAPMGLAAALLVAAPGGVAFAADDPPPAPVDDAGTALGDVLGTNSAADSDSGSDDGDTDAPVTGADVVEDSGATTEDAEEGTADDAEEGTGEQSAAEVEPAGSGATEVTLLEKNGSGVTGSAAIDAENIVATATGLDPDARYVSFVYGATSSATNNYPSWRAARWSAWRSSTR